MSLKPERILSLLLAVGLLAGLFLLSSVAFADTNGDKLQQMLEALGVPNPLPTKYRDAWARLDRGCSRICIAKGKSTAH